MRRTGPGRRMLRLPQSPGEGEVSDTRMNSVVPQREQGKGTVSAGCSGSQKRTRSVAR